MALVVKDRVQETTTTTGTGTLTLGGAVLGFQSFATIGNGNATYYTINDTITGDWEVGIGTYTASGTTLSRTTVLSSSNGGALVSFAAGSKNVFVTYPSERAVYKDLADVYTVQQAFDALTANSIALTTGTISTAPVNNTDIVNKQYADAIASGIHFHEAVDLATTAALPANTYNNGASGVGATLTANANGALSVDSTLTVASNRILVKNEAAQANNGVYTVTQVGSAGTPYILTRATDFDTAGTGVDQIDEGDFFLVTSGVVNRNTAWVQQTAPPITVGTTAIVFQQFAAPITYTAGTGLSESPAYTFNIASTGVTAATYGSASQVPVFAVNAQGQITSVLNTAIAIAAGAVSGLAASATTDTTNAANITSGTLPTGRLSGSYTGITGVGTLTAGTWNGSVIGPVYGGTGFGTYAVGDLLYADTTSSLAKLADVAVGNALISGGVGSAPSWGKIGLATHVSGTLPIANGGTNTSATATNGGVTYGTGTAYAFTAAGTSGQVLQSNGAAAPTWVNLSTLGVSSFSAGTTGFTPSSATSGAVTLAGTLNVANGGTGLTSFTNGGIVYASSTSALATGSALTWNGSALAVTGTLSATSTVSAGNGENVFGTGGTGATSSSITLNGGSTSGWGSFITFKRNSVSKGFVGLESQLIGNNSDDTIVYAISGQNVKQVVNAATITTTSSTGLAVTGTLSSSTDATVGSAGGTRTLTIGNPAVTGAGFINFVTSNAFKNWQIASNQYVASALSFTPSTAAGGTTFTTPVLNILDTGLAVTGALSTTGNITNSNAAGRLDFTGGSSAQVWATASSLYLDASTGQSVIIRPNNQVTAGTFSSTGLAVTGTLTASVDMRAPIFYDSNNTAYYLDPNSTTSAILAGSVGVGSTSPVNSAWGTAANTKQITIYGSDYGVLNIRGDLATAAHYSLGVGGTRYYAAYDNVASVHRMVFFGNYTGFNNVTTPAYNIHLAGTGYATGDWRAPIFYDSNDTTYYVDPNSRSVLSSLNVGSATTIGTGKLSVFAGGASGVGWATGFNLGDASNYTTWIQDAGVSRFRNTGTGGMDWYNSSASAQIMSLSDAGNLIAPAGSMRAPIFYDSGNTAYYGDFASTSNFNRLNLVGWDSSGRNYSREWIEFPNYTGIYSPNNDAHFYPNNQSSYTPWIVRGSRNTWHGLHFYAGGNTPHLMFDGSANGGIYYETGSRWASYYLYANNCWGFGTSTTNSAYNIYCSTGIYSGGRVDGTIFYDASNTAYYLDPNSTSNTLNLNYGLASFSGTVNLNISSFTSRTFYSANQITTTAPVGVLIATSTDYVGTNGASTSSVYGLASSPAVSNSGAGGNFSNPIYGVFSAPQINTTGSLVSGGIAAGGFFTVDRTNANDNGRYSSMYGLYGRTTVQSGTGTASVLNMYGVWGYAEYSGNSTTTNAYGGYFDVNQSSSGVGYVTTTIAGVFARGRMGTVASTNLYGVQANVVSGQVTLGTLTQPNATIFDGSATIGAVGTIVCTNFYGLRLRTPSIAAGGSITNHWGVYQEASTAQNYFAGNLFVGATSVAYLNSNSCIFTGGGATTTQVIINHASTATTGQVYVAFAYNASGIGSITQNGTTAVSYNTTSDYRLKRDVAPMTGALERIARLKPVTYKWNADGSGGEGFIAHELAEVFPLAVTGEKDATREEEYEIEPAVKDDEGNEIESAVKGTRTVPAYQGIDTSFLVAALTAAVQELSTQVKALSLELADLKAKS